MSVNLPTPENNSGTNDWSDVYGNDKALKEAVESLETKVSTLEAESPVTWYTPKIVSTEQSRTSTEYGFLTTEDKIESVKLAENGLILVGFTALAKCSVELAGRAAIFVGANQVKVAAEGAPAVQEVTLIPSFRPLSTTPTGLASREIGATSYVTTGQLLATKAEGEGGLAYIFAAAGTYTVGIKYKASSGSVTAKERKLWVATMG